MMYNKLKNAANDPLIYASNPVCPLSVFSLLAYLILYFFCMCILLGLVFFKDTSLPLMSNPTGLITGINQTDQVESSAAFGHARHERDGLALIT